MEFVLHRGPLKFLIVPLYIDLNGLVVDAIILVLVTGV